MSIKSKRITAAACAVLVTASCLSPLNIIAADTPTPETVNVQLLSSSAYENSSTEQGDNKVSITSGDKTYYYADVDAALSDAQENDTITLLGDVTIVNRLKPAVSIVLDLNNHKITAENLNNYYLLTTNSVKVEIKNGEIIANNWLFGTSGTGELTLRNIVISDSSRVVKSAYPISVTGNATVNLIDTEVEYYGSCATAVNNGVLNVDNSKLTSHSINAVISSNATKTGKNNISITNGSVIKNDVGMCIYQPGDGAISITKSKFEGVSGIALQAGTLNITDSTITTSGERVNNLYAVTGSAENDGFGIFLCSNSNESYQGGIKLTVSGNSVITSAQSSAIRTAANEGTTSETAANKINSITINGGKFTSATGIDAIELADFDTKTVTVNDGTFSSDISKIEGVTIAEGKAVKANADGTYSLVSNDVIAAAAVVTKIEAIGEVEYSNDCKTKIEEARTAYNALTDAQKALITEAQLKVLTDAETKYAELEKAANTAAENKAAAAAVVTKIEAIGEVEYSNDCKAKIDDARTAYNALTDAQKALITEEKLKVLTDAEAAYSALEKEANTAAENQAAATAVVEKINAIGEVEYTEASKAKIEAARTAYDALTDAQKELITEAQLKVLTDAETAYDELTPVEKTITAIAVTTEPTKTTYAIGDELDVTGGKITVTYSDDSTEELDITAEMVTGFDSSEAGTKTLTVTYEGKTAEFTVTVEKGEITIEPSDDNVGDAKIDMPVEEVVNAIIDTEDEKLIEEGVNISVKMTIEAVEPENVAEEDKGAIEEVLDEFTVGCYIDANIYKQYSNGDPDKQVTDLSSPISISFEIPQEILDQYPDDEYVYGVFCSHNEVGYEVESSYDAESNTITFTSDKFSTYALAVKEYDPIDAFVERLYENVLGRHSDPAKVSHVENLKNGESASKVAYDFVFSPEFTELDITNEERVTIMYNTFLNRDPDPAGLETWVKSLENGCSIGHIFYGFTQSKEFGEICEEYGITRGTWEYTENRDKSEELTAFVSRLYTKALNRKFDVDGLNDHTGSYLENHDLYQMAYNFIFSPEFIEMNLSDEDFVDTMYRTFFDREGDPDGRADWLGKIKSGMSREEVLAGFVGSQECADMVARFGI